MRPSGENASPLTNIPAASGCVAIVRAAGRVPQLDVLARRPRASRRSGCRRRRSLAGRRSTGDGSVHIDTVPSASPDATRPGPSQATEVTGCGRGSVAVSARVAVFQTSTLASDVPAAMVACRPG